MANMVGRFVPFSISYVPLTGILNLTVDGVLFTATLPSATFDFAVGTFGWARGNATVMPIVKNSSMTVNGVNYVWLDDVQDYKGVPPNGSITGTPVWYKLASDGDEINNYLTGTLLHNALIATPPTQPVTVYILDAGQDVSMIQTQYNGQPVSIDRGFLPKRSAQRKFGFGFGFQF
jgi:hypothetical protein